MTRMLWSLSKSVSQCITRLCQTHSILKERKSFGGTRCRNLGTSSKQRQNHIPLSPGRMGSPGSARNTLTAELETTRTSRNPTAVMTANGEVQTHATGSTVKNHISSKMAGTSNAMCGTSYHSLSLVYHRILPQLPFTCFQSEQIPKIQYKKGVEVRVEIFGDRCTKQKPNTKIKNGESEKHKDKNHMNSLGSRNWWRIWLMKQSLGETPENNYHHAVVVQDLTTQWIQSHPCKTRTFPGDPRERNEIPGADKESKSHWHWHFLGIGQSLWRSIFPVLQIGNKRDCWKSSAQNEGRHLCCIAAIRSKWKLVSRFHGIICETISCLMGRQHLKGCSECPSTNQ